MWYKNLIIFVLVILSIVMVYFLLIKDNNKSYTAYIADTNIISKYNNEIKRDTVYKIIDRIVTKKEKPEKIYIQKIDTLFIEKIKNYDLPLRIEKSNSQLKIQSVNINDSLLKEYIYKDVTKDFILTSVKNNLQLKTQNFYFYKPEIGINYQYNLNNKKSNYSLSIESGISYRERITLNAVSIYKSEPKEFEFGFSLKFKIY